MPTIKQNIAYWADSLQEPLLRASFLSGASARSAWEVWKSQVDLDDYPDPGSFRLLPQLYRNLQSQGIDDPLMSKLKGIARQNWFRNQRDFNVLSPHLEMLKAAGVNMLLFGGIALALRYPDYPLHAEPFLTTLVRPEQAVIAMRELGDLGWHSRANAPEVLQRAFVTHRDLQNFDGPNNLRIRLLWRLFPNDSDESIWDRAEILGLHNHQISVLGSSDQILYHCAQGQLPGKSPLFLRAVDVMLILRAAENNLDWEHIVRGAQKYQLQSCLTETFRYLQETLEAPLPADLYSRLVNLPASTPIQTTRSKERSEGGSWSKLKRVWLDYIDQVDPVNLWQKVYYFPRYLQYLWRLPHLWQVPMKALSRILRLWR